jgi:hypothetical protein
METEERIMRLGRKLVLSLVMAASFGLMAAQPASAALIVNVMNADRLNASTVQATVSVTCDPQPIGTSFVALALTLFQGNAVHGTSYREGQGGVGLEGINGLICDGAAHTYSFPVRLTSFFTDKRFTPGPAGFEWFVQACTTTTCTGLGGPTQGRITIQP